jgi:hypothetical protein
LAALVRAALRGEEEEPDASRPLEEEVGGREEGGREGEAAGEGRTEGVVERAIEGRRGLRRRAKKAECVRTTDCCQAGGKDESLRFGASGRLPSLEGEAIESKRRASAAPSQSAREQSREGRDVPSLEPLGRLHLHSLPLLGEPIRDALATEPLVGPPRGVGDALRFGQVHRGELGLESGLLERFIIDALLVNGGRLGRP